MEARWKENETTKDQRESVCVRMCVDNEAPPRDGGLGMCRTRVCVCVCVCVDG